MWRESVILELSGCMCVIVLMFVGGVVRAQAAGREFNDGVFIYQVINEEDKTCQVIGVVQGSME